ncbi:MAG: DUF4282 domain-containing protein [Acidimicrobiales bacterium]|nr:DUF4282 domain-containing protein [Hyphomonadaceae bacterium]RZV41298.1 MAG: DUF4282 domain-containing protein [Acidimicrobiales bacterium]
MLNYFLKFDKLIGTQLIKVLYFVGLAGIILFGVLGFISGFSQGIGTSIAALVGAVVGIVFWRFLCEIYLLFFRLSDDVRDIKNHQLGIKANTKDVDIDF